MRIDFASSTSARSFCKAIIRLTRVRCSYTMLPAASLMGTNRPFSCSFIAGLPVGRMPKRMTVGPILMSSDLTSASTRKLRSVSWIVLANIEVSSPNKWSLTSSGLFRIAVSTNFHGDSTSGGFAARVTILG